MRINIFFFLCLLLFVSACQTKQPKLTEVAFQGAAQGTNYMVKYFPLVERINTKITTITNRIGYYNLIMILIIMLAIIVEYITM